MSDRSIVRTHGGGPEISGAILELPTALVHDIELGELAVNGAGLLTYRRNGRPVPGATVLERPLAQRPQPKPARKGRKKT